MSALQRRRQHGFVAIEFVAGMGLLLVPIGILAMVFPTWAERQDMGRVAAREAARIYVLTGSESEAQDTVSQIAQNYDLKANQVRLNGFTTNVNDGGTSVTASVTVEVPATSIPVLNLNADAFSFTVRQTEAVDTYRSVPTP